MEKKQVVKQQVRKPLIAVGAILTSMFELGSTSDPHILFDRKTSTQINLIGSHG